MNVDDPRTPLLGGVRQNRIRNAAARLCSVQSWKQRLPITIWLPNYKREYLLRDAIAGITVGLTSIPQGIAYALVAGLPPQVGLYSSIFPGIVYALFGSCKDVTVGPTAILAALLAKYVAKSPDFAYLASFLSGCVILVLGILQLGFLLDFISKPVISAFTTAAALQISASQLKPLFRIKGASGDTFVSAVINFCRNISTAQLWDPVLGVLSIIVLLLLKRLSPAPSESSARPYLSGLRTHVARGRNALLVFGTSLLAYCLHLYGITPFALTGKIEGGLPHFAPPPFSTTVNNTTLRFPEMLAAFGPEGLVMPLVAILESIAIAKAFSGSQPVDGTQEMIAIGACNLVSSCAQCMPATGSFTRTALNHAAGVTTQAGSLFKAALVLLCVCVLSDAFYYIPRAALSAVIVVAMSSIVQVTIVRTLWRNAKVELIVWVVTVVAGCSVGLEYGILCGVTVCVVTTLSHAASPHIHTDRFKVGNIDCVSLTPLGVLNSASVTRVQHALSAVTARCVLVDGKYITAMDIGIAEGIISSVKDMEGRGHTCLLWNFKLHHQTLFRDLAPDIASRFVGGPSVDQYILEIDSAR